MTELRRTPLTAWHEQHGGRMVDFAGYLMPVQYEGVMAEHRAVRQACGIFDISHMAEIALLGAGARAALDRLVTNNIATLAPGRAVYTALCNERGTVLDDLIVYCLDDARFLVVANASNRNKVVAWMRDHLAPGAQLEDDSDATALIAVQGPRSLAVMGAWPRLREHLAQLRELAYYRAFTLTLDGAGCLLSRTGYTGERGYELYAPAAKALLFWEELVAAGRAQALAPVGLGARDTLRLEAGYCLYGHELDEETTPFEAGIGWVVKLEGRAFIGRDALVRHQQQGVAARTIGLLLQERAIARQGAVVHCGGEPIGRVTSGTFSPTLQRGIALARLERDPAAAPLSVDVRGKLHQAEITAVPFVPTRVKD
jgi:aminomethyltransferase